MSTIIQHKIILLLILQAKLWTAVCLSSLLIGGTLHNFIIIIIQYCSSSYICRECYIGCLNVPTPKYEVLTCIVHAVKVKTSKYWEKMTKHSNPEYTVYTNVSVFYMYCHK